MPIIRRFWSWETTTTRLTIPVWWTFVLALGHMWDSAQSFDSIESTNSIACANCFDEKNIK